MTGVSTRKLCDLAHEAREQVPAVQGNCGEIIDHLSNLLIEREMVPYPLPDDLVFQRRHVRVGPNGEEKHYVLELSGSLVKDTPNNGTILVDASFDQFNERNAKSNQVEVSYGKRPGLREVRVLLPGERRRKSQYQTVGEFFS